jgi:hypothetical protein
MVLLGAIVKLQFGGVDTPRLRGWTISPWRPRIPEADLLALSGTISNAGALFGLGAGRCGCGGGGFDAQGAWHHRLLRFPLGLLGVLLIWYGLGAVFPVER